MAVVGSRPVHYEYGMILPTTTVHNGLLWRYRPYLFTRPEPGEIPRAEAGRVKKQGNCQRSVSIIAHYHHLCQYPGLLLPPEPATRNKKTNTKAVLISPSTIDCRISLSIFVAQRLRVLPSWQLLDCSSSTADERPIHLVPIQQSDSGCLGSTPREILTMEPSISRHQAFFDPHDHLCHGRSVFLVALGNTAKRPGIFLPGMKLIPSMIALFQLFRHRCFDTFWHCISAGRLERYSLDEREPFHQPWGVVALWSPYTPLH